MDLTKFSDADLLALQAGDISKLSDNGLTYIKSVQKSETNAPSIPVKMGRGMMDFYEGTKQKYLNWTDPAAADQYTADKNYDRSIYSANRAAAGETGFDGWRMLGNVATPTALVGGGASLPARAAIGMVQGAGNGYLDFNPENTESGNATRAALGGVVGGAVNAAAPSIVKGLTSGYQWAKNKVGDAVSTLASPQALAYQLTGKIPVQVELTLKQQLSGGGMGINWNNLDEGVKKQLIDEGVSVMAKTGNFSGPEAQNLIRKAGMVSQGFTPTKGMVTRSPVDWTIERNLQKGETAGAILGDSITAIDQSNQNAARTGLKKLSENTGGASGSSYSTGKKAFETIEKISDDSQKAVSEVYNEIRKVHGDKSGITMDNVKSFLDGIKDSAYADKLHSTIKAKMDSMADPQTGTLTVSQAEELRKWIGKVVPKTEFGASDAKRAIDADVLASAGEDFFKGARNGAMQRFQKLHNPAIQKVLSTAGELGEDKTAMNWVNQQIINGGPGDIAHLKNVLNSGDYGGKGGGELWNNIRRRTMEWLAEEAQGAQGAVSGTNLNKALEKLGEDRMQVIFDANERSAIAKFQQALESATVEPFGSAPNRSNTAPALAAMLRKMGVGQNIPVIGPMVSQQIQAGAENMAKSTLLAKALKASPIDNTARDVAQDQTAKRLARLLGNRSGLGAVPGAAYQANED